MLIMQPWKFRNFVVAMVFFSVVSPMAMAEMRGTSSTVHRQQLKAEKLRLIVCWKKGLIKTTKLLRCANFNHKTSGEPAKTETTHKRSLVVVQPGEGRQAASKNNTTPGFSHPYYWSPFILIGNGL